MVKRKSEGKIGSSPSNNRAKREVETPLNIKDIPKTSSIAGIKYLSCQGGGMKGIGYVGAIRELDNLGVLQQLEEVAGSSAGAMFALMIAIGCDAEELKTEMINMDFKSFQDQGEVGWIKASKIKQLLRGGVAVIEPAERVVRLVKHLPFVGEVAKKLSPVQLLHKALKGAEKGLSIAEKGEDVVGMMLGSELGLWEGDTLTYFLANLVARKTGNPNITFRELAVLCEANGSPFKKLTLTGSNLTTGKVEYYNAENTPDMPIIQAARISASFPGAYKPVIVDRKDKDGNPVLDDKGNVIKDTKVDGGLLENLPDVFNQPPYLTPDSDNGSKGNRYAFALSFTSQAEEEPQNITTLAELGTAMYLAKTSEEPLTTKYGNSIASIDTVGMGTLDFDASDEHKKALIESGAKSVRNAFRNILQQEGEVNYSELPIDELIRIKVALSERNKEKISPEEQKENNDILIEIIKELKYRVDKKIVSKDYGIVTDKLIEERENLAKKSFLRKKRIDKAKLTDRQLSEMCVKKREELDEITKQLAENLRKLELAKAALELNRDIIIEKYNKDDSKNDFVKELWELKRLEDVINNNLLLLAQENNPQKLIILKEKQEKLKKEKYDYYQKLIEKYTTGVSQNKELADFFGDLLQDSGKSKFVIPTSADDLWNYCSKDIDSCEKYINEARGELEIKTFELALFEQHKQKLDERTDKTSRFESLILLNKELDKTIRRRTTILTKINHFLIRKAPKLERVILTFSKVVAFLSFACWLPLGIPAIGIAKTIGYLATSKDVKATAENVIDFFSLTNVDSENRLRKLKEETSKFIKKMSDNYAVADKSEITYLHKLHELYLKNSGVKIEDIFIRNPDESLDKYKARIKEETERLYTESRVLKVGKEETKRLYTESQVLEMRDKSEMADTNFKKFTEVMKKDISKAVEREERKLEDTNPRSREVTKSKVLKAQLALKEQAEKISREEELRRAVKELEPKKRDELLPEFRKVREKHSGVKGGKVRTSVKHKKTPE